MTDQSQSRNCELKPCPFCGSAAKGDDGFLPMENVFYVWCSNEMCGCSPVGRGERMFTVDEWNRRAPVSELGRNEVQDLKATVNYLASANSLLTGRSVEAILKEAEDHQWP